MEKQGILGDADDVHHRLLHSYVQPLHRPVDVPQRNQHSCQQVSRSDILSTNYFMITVNITTSACEDLSKHGCFFSLFIFWNQNNLWHAYCKVLKLPYMYVWIDVHFTSRNISSSHWISLFECWYDCIILCSCDYLNEYSEQYKWLPTLLSIHYTLINVYQVLNPSTLQCRRYEILLNHSTFTQYQYSWTHCRLRKRKEWIISIKEYFIVYTAYALRLYGSLHLLWTCRIGMKMTFELD